MNEEISKKIELFKKRVEDLYAQVCRWLEEGRIEFDKKESSLTLTEGLSGPYAAKRLDIFTKDNERLFSLVPYGIWVIGAEGRVELEGDSGTESLIYLSEEDMVAKEKLSEKENILRHKLNGSLEEGWHWLDERITGKKPLFTRDIFLALLERIN
jgi:hypothetical protein